MRNEKQMITNLRTYEPIVVDKLIAPLLETLWERGISPVISSQNRRGKSYVGFITADEAFDFFKDVLKVTRKAKLKSAPELFIVEFPKEYLEGAIKTAEDNKLFYMKERSDNEISEALDELIDRVWHERHLVSRFKIENNMMEDPPEPKFWESCKDAAAKVAEKYEQLGPYDTFEWGMINGKLSALRWIGGEEWDMLDT